MAICWKREWKSQPIINITRLLSSEPWSITFAKSTRSRGADDVIQSINAVTGEIDFNVREGSSPPGVEFHNAVGENLVNWLWF